MCAIVHTLTYITTLVLSLSRLQECCWLHDAVIVNSLKLVFLHCRVLFLWPPKVWQNAQLSSKLFVNGKSSSDVQAVIPYSCKFNCIHIAALIPKFVFAEICSLSNNIICTHFPLSLLLLSLGGSSQPSLADTGSPTRA